MINDVIHQIIELDKRAAEIKNSAVARADKIVSDTKNHLKKEETRVITEAKEQSKQNYDVEIERAKAEKENIVAEMSGSIAAVRKQYEKAKEDSAKKVLDELFRSV